MQIGLNYLFASQVQDIGPFRNSHVQNASPIGNQLDDAAITDKPADLIQLLSKYDLRQITPRQLAELGGELYKRGEISDNAVGAMIGMLGDIDGTTPDKPVDAIQHFEKMLSVVSEAINDGEQELAFAKNYRNEALHTIYNLDRFIHSSSKGITFHDMT
ncbi:hypothetical protein ABWL39_06460 [Chitinivorax sp. PXF-14]|uniref:hypothetical protein n=1 Tax=Chitinivorax sp. PXF-14 TaxID=3230488 RepID=UPI00346532A2